MHKSGAVEGEQLSGATAPRNSKMRPLRMRRNLHRRGEDAEVGAVGAAGGGLAAGDVEGVMHMRRVVLSALHLHLRLERPLRRIGEFLLTSQC